MGEMTVSTYVAEASEFLAAGFTGVGTVINGIWSSGVIGQISLLGAGLGVVFTAYRLAVKRR
ncbi:MAG: hypothetical protein II309_01040 [Bacilli bacterium]|nr:hypothetical protein [Bacilli bacterium]